LNQDLGDVAPTISDSQDNESTDADSTINEADYHEYTIVRYLWNF
jgi:hypothetical protein